MVGEDMEDMEDLEDLEDLEEGNVGGSLYSRVTGSSSFRLLLRLMAVCSCGFVLDGEFLLFVCQTVSFVMEAVLIREVRMTRCSRLMCV